MKPTTDQMIEMLRTMLTIRHFEVTARTQYGHNRDLGSFLGALHSYEGQEAIAAGSCACLRRDDYVLSSHRGHGHFIAKGGDVKAMLAEILGKESGCSKGRGGSMHMFDVKLGLLGGNGVVGGGIPLALGPAFSAQYRGTDQVSVAFFGEGASSQGVFHEAMNLAALWRLPIIFMCENNRYAVRTPACEGVSVPEISVRAAGYGCPGVTVDGNDPVAVFEATSEAVVRARTGDGPSLIEAVACRQQPHCMVIAENRQEAELEQMRECDPLPNYETRLLTERLIDHQQLQAMKDEVTNLMDEAVAYAEAAPYPDRAAVHDYMWA